MVMEFLYEGPQTQGSGSGCRAQARRLALPRRHVPRPGGRRRLRLPARPDEGGAVIPPRPCAAFYREKPEGFTGRSPRDGRKWRCRTAVKSSSLPAPVRTIAPQHPPSPLPPASIWLSFVGAHWSAPVARAGRRTPMTRRRWLVEHGLALLSHAIAPSNCCARLALAGRVDRALRHGRRARRLAHADPEPRQLSHRGGKPRAEQTYWQLLLPKPIG